MHMCEGRTLTRPALSSFQSWRSVCVHDLYSFHDGSVDMKPENSERNSQLSLGAGEQLHIMHATSVGDLPLWLYFCCHMLSLPYIHIQQRWCISSQIVLTCNCCMIYSNCPMSHSWCFTHTLISLRLIPAIEHAVRCERLKINPI